MLIQYRTSELETECTDARVASRKYGDEMARRLQLRILQLRNATDLRSLLQLHIGRCHALKGDRKGQYAMDLVHPMRLIFIIVEGQVQIASI